MKSIFFTFSILFLFATKLFAQNAHFVTQGIVEFDKSVNMYAIIKKSINKDNEGYILQAFEQYKKAQPQFMVLKSTLAFSKDKLLFTPKIPETGLLNNSFANDPAVTQPNVIFTDLTLSNSICQKKVYEETFLVKDSIRKISWKITDEKRDIAGYSCRRANALIMDSIYVVAFYTEEIPVSGGPESFTGLPGMILGVALPHENITWFATKVTERQPETKELSVPIKGKVVNNKSFRETIQSALKSWGSYAQSAFKAFLL